VNWDLRYDMPPAFIHYLAHVTAAVVGDTHWGPEGPLVIPGVYTLRLNVDGKTYSQTVTVKNDPNSSATHADLEALHDLQMKLYAGAKESWDGFQQVATMRKSIADVLAGNPPADIGSAVRALDTKLAALAGPTTFTPGPGGAGARTAFSVINGVEAEEGTVLVSMNGQLKVIDMSDIPPNPTKRAAWRSVCTDLRTAVTNWREINTKDLVALNMLLAKNNINQIPAASLSLPLPVCAPPGDAERDR